MNVILIIYNLQIILKNNTKYKFNIVIYKGIDYEYYNIIN